MVRLVEPGLLNLAVLASGRGSNFEALCAAIERGNLNAKIAVLISDQKEALALTKAEKNGIDNYCIYPQDFADREAYETCLVNLLSEYQVNIVALAGYMRLVGRKFLQNYRNRIVNIHPALLPAFQGLHAQNQALEYGVKFSGCTVHIVDEGMDTGPIIMQAVVPVYDNDSEDTLSERILREEHRIYWQSLQLFAEGRIYLEGRRIRII